MPAVSSRGRGRRTISEINMVPFIDVMLVLLIIFMVTAPLISPSQINLPSVGQAARQPDRYVQVVIDKSGQLKVHEGKSDTGARFVGLADLPARIQQLQGAAGAANPANAMPVVISADKGVQYEAVVKVMDTLNQAGVTRVGLSVQASR
ncbi:ExbD/TolR family protein [Hydrogenophaga sp.]|uniref:ExbD/TolR family protein n=1 Tax=Hydrogenophaga sp. TaxID=1904254 RepID=UPI0035669E27